MSDELQPEQLTDDLIRGMDPAEAVRVLIETLEVSEDTAREMVQRVHHGEDLIVPDGRGGHEPGRRA